MNAVIGLTKYKRHSNTSNEHDANQNMILMNSCSQLGSKLPLLISQLEPRMSHADFDPDFLDFDDGAVSDADNDDGDYDVHDQVDLDILTPVL